MAFPDGEWRPVAADASTRRYFRGRFRGRPALLADFGEDADGRRRFLHVARLFEGHGIRVPAILDAPEGESFLIEEWVEGEKLSRLRWTKSFEGPLLNAAAAIAAIEPWRSDPPLLHLDYRRLLFELSFFSVHFLEGFLNSPAGPEANEALEFLSKTVDSYPKILAHRDFHSENVLVGRGGSFVILDFQDALMAPRAYDAASLAVDAYRYQDPGIRRRFLSTWCDSSGAPGVEALLTALQRALKALGTFGYQVTRLKRARYLAFIAPQARHALALLKDAPPALRCLVPLLEKAENR